MLSSRQVPGGFRHDFWRRIEWSTSFSSLSVISVGRPWLFRKCSVVHVGMLWYERYIGFVGVSRWQIWIQGIEIMPFDGRKLDFHEIWKFQDFLQMWPLLAAHVLKNARGSSLARISMPAAPRPGWGPGPPRRRIEITPAIYFLENYNCDREICCMFVGVHLVS